MFAYPRALPSFRRPGLAAGLCVATLLLVTAGSRAAGAEGPEEVVRGLSKDAVAILSDAGLDTQARDARFRQLLVSRFDLERVGRFALGKHWKSATAAERAEYRGLFEDYIMAVYVARLDGYSREALTIVGSRVKQNGGAVVSSELPRAAARPVQIDWCLRRDGESWRITDLVVEGVSLALTQRAQFDSVIRSSGGRIDGLLAKLREFVA